MKKMLLLSLCVILMLSIVGCSASGRPAPTVTPSCDAYVGMPTKEFWTLYDNEDVEALTGLSDENYYFIEDANGNPVVLTLKSINKNYTITAIAAYDKNKIELSSRSFFSIKAGMTVQEVISILGYPSGSGFSTGDRLSWKVDDTLFYVLFRGQPGDPSISVVNDVIISGENYTSIINHWYIPFID